MVQMAQGRVDTRLVVCRCRGKPARHAVRGPDRVVAVRWRCPCVSNCRGRRVRGRSAGRVPVGTSLTAATDGLPVRLKSIRTRRAAAGCAVSHRTRCGACPHLRCERASAPHVRGHPANWPTPPPANPRARAPLATGRNDLGMPTWVLFRRWLRPPPNPRRTHFPRGVPGTSHRTGQCRLWHPTGGTCPGAGRSWHTASACCRSGRLRHGCR